MRYRTQLKVTSIARESSSSSTQRTRGRGLDSTLPPASRDDYLNGRRLDQLKTSVCALTHIKDTLIQPLSSINGRTFFLIGPFLNFPISARVLAHRSPTPIAHDYEVNLKAELEILSLHEKIDELREMKWAELITMQQEQIRLLTQLTNEHVAETTQGETRPNDNRC